MAEAVGWLVGDELGELLGELLGDVDGDGLGEVEGDGEGLGDGLGDGEGLGEGLAEGLGEGLDEGDGLGEGRGGGDGNRPEKVCIASFAAALAASIAPWIGSVAATGDARPSTMLLLANITAWASHGPGPLSDRLTPISAHS